MLRQRGAAVPLSPEKASTSSKNKHACQGWAQVLTAMTVGGQLTTIRPLQALHSAQKLQQCVSCEVCLPAQARSLQAGTEQQHQKCLIHLQQHLQGIKVAAASAAA